MPPIQDPRVIVTSPDDVFRQTIKEALQVLRWTHVDAISGADALNKLDSLAGIEAVIFEHSLPDLDVDDLDVSLRALRPTLDVLLVDLNAQEPCRSNRGLIHARSKELIWQLERAGTGPTNETSVGPERTTEASRQDWEPLSGMVGGHAGMEELSRLVRLVAPRKTSVLITGETGTGKELVARALHQMSSRTNGPFVAVNCAAIPDTLLESELFGYARGAFTGAVQPKAGRIEAANGGTLFLDEIGELPLALQAKLLRFLQEREVQRLGSNETITVDVRIVSATHEDLLSASSAKAFRQDLYYRLAVFPIALPPLRKRAGDVLLLARHFLSDICQKDGIPPKLLTPEACGLLCEYEWPGNVRELQHVIERAFILAEDESALTLQHFPTLNPEKILNLA